MSASFLYRTSAVLLVLFAAGHQFGFRIVSPAWHADDVVRGMQATRFAVQGFSRTYWGFYSGFGFFVTAFLIFSAVLAWSFARTPRDLLARESALLWTFAGCYVVIALMTWAYFFLAPGVFASLVAACLVAAAVQVQRAGTPADSVVREYFDRLSRRDGWDQTLADSLAFTSFTSPVKRVTGRDAYLTATKRFYSSIGSVELRDLTVSGDKAYALTHYVIRPPNGAPPFDTDVAEIFHVRDGRIDALDIYFDSAPFPK